MCFPALYDTKKLIVLIMNVWKIFLIIVPMIPLVELECEGDPDCNEIRQRTKRNANGAINERTFKKTEIYKDSIKVLSSPSWPSTKVECAALCLSTPSCYAIDYVSSNCRFLYEHTANFDVDTSQGKMTICLDHQNWNRHEVYLPDDNTPPMCPIHGHWSGWGAFSACNDIGPWPQKSRTRTCTNPTPQYNGYHCSHDGSSDTDTHYCRCRFHPIPGNECPDELNIGECHWDMQHNELCEADQELPDGYSDFDNNNCGFYDMFRCIRDQ